MWAWQVFSKSLRRSTIVALLGATQRSDPPLALSVPPPGPPTVPPTRCGNVREMTTQDRDTFLAKLDRYALLRGYHPDDDEDTRDSQRDTGDAAALWFIAREFSSVREKVATHATAKAALNRYDAWVVKRAGRVLFETIWESPRRRRGRVKTTCNEKYATGGLWSPTARSLMVKNGKGEWHLSKPGGLVLEHVVPASTITGILAQLPEDPARVATVLSQLVVHAVLAKGEELAAQLPVQLSAQDAASLTDHYVRPTVPALSEAELRVIRWSRYLTADRRATRVPMDDFGPLEP